MFYNIVFKYLPSPSVVSNGIIKSLVRSEMSF